MEITRDDMFRIVCMIYTPSTGKVGTGNFIVNNDDCYIVTAEHVKNNVMADTIIVFGEANSTNHTVLLSDITSGVWRIHATADLAAIQLDHSKLNHRFQNRFLPMSQVLSSQETLSRDVELTVAGFPSGLGVNITGSHKFSPLTFRTYLSSSYISMARADNGKLCDFVCLENPSMGGYSGGPVFDLGYLKTPLMLQHYGETKLLAFVHGTMSDKTGGKIALVTPGYYLQDII